MPLSQDSHIVVTGGAGFIGSNVVAALNARGHRRITIVDRLGTGEKWKNLRGLRFDEYVDKDDFLQRVADGDAREAAAIVHMGATSATTERDADYLARNNYAYSRRLCEWSFETGARLVLASSAATYGDGARGYNDDDEQTPECRPLNMYGMSKQMFDEWALEVGHYKRIVGLKFFNVYGPRESHKGDMRSVVNKAYHQVLAEGRISLFKSDRPDYADGMQRRDFIYVRDAVDQILYFVEKPTINGLFNCGTGQARTWLDLALAVFSAMHREPNVHWIGLPEHLAGKYQYFTQANLDKLRRAGYDTSFTSLEDGVADYVGWLERGER